MTTDKARDTSHRKRCSQHVQTSPLGQGFAESPIPAFPMVTYPVR